MADTALYERDFYTWTQQQAAFLRELRGHNRLDTDHLAEEIADLGKAELRAVRNNLERCFEHLLKLAVSPADAPKGHWARETERFADNVRAAYSPGMRQHLDPGAIWTKAGRAAHLELSDYGEGGLPVAPPCPVTLDAVLDPGFDIDAAVARLHDSLGEDERA